MTRWRSGASSVTFAATAAGGPSWMFSFATVAGSPALTSNLTTLSTLLAFAFKACADVEGIAGFDGEQVEAARLVAKRHHAVDGLHRMECLNPDFHAQSIPAVKGRNPRSKGVPGGSIGNCGLLSKGRQQ